MTNTKTWAERSEADREAALTIFGKKGSSGGQGWNDVVKFYMVRASIFAALEIADAIRDVASAIREQYVIQSLKDKK